MARETFNTEAEAIERVAVCDRLMGLPTPDGSTLTYAIPEQDLEGNWYIMVWDDIYEKEAQNELTE